MNIALILDADAASFFSQARDLGAFLGDSGIAAQECELWLFCRSNTRAELPVFTLPVRRIVWLRVPDATDVAEQRLALLEQGWRISQPALLLFTDRDAGAELATRLACRLNGSACAGIERARITAQGCEVEKAVYANNMGALLTPGRAPWCLSVARTGGAGVEVVRYAAPQHEITLAQEQPDWLVACSAQKVSIENPLLQAERVLAVGQGIGGAENLCKLQPLAEKLGAEIGVSRPVAMNHWCEMERMLGMSGAMTAPDICLVVGASGAAAFVAGIRRSRFVAAINRDPDAAIFTQADVGIVDDLHDVVVALMQCMEEDEH